MQILILPEEGWFGQQKYSTLKKVMLRCIGLGFYFLEAVDVLDHDGRHLPSIGEQILKKRQVEISAAGLQGPRDNT